MIDAVLPHACGCRRLGGRICCLHSQLRDVCVTGWFPSQHLGESDVWIRVAEAQAHTIEARFLVSRVGMRVVSVVETWCPVSRRLETQMHLGGSNRFPVARRALCEEKASFVSSRCKASGFGCCASQVPSAVLPFSDAAPVGLAPRILAPNGRYPSQPMGSVTLPVDKCSREN